MALVRRDDRSPVRPAGRHPARRRDGRAADVDHEHRRLHVERHRRGAAGDHRPPRVVPSPAGDADDPRGHGAPPAERPVLQLVRPHDRREAHRLAADGGAAHTDPLVGRQRLARDGAANRREQGAGGRRPRAGDLRQHGLRLLLPARGQPDPLSLRPRHRRRGVLLRHGRQREPDRELHRDRQRPAAGPRVLRRLAQLPRHLRLELAGDPAAGPLADLSRGVRVRGRLPLRGHARHARPGAGACSRR